ncbi:glycoside hydrolase domain-containing protein [Arthrobacter sp. LAPM80]|uniref:glycoside hydrolase domain-containing protein n=1 Tax=Arthrobacter sp. LAPM80 TaxID=3141788 RepID=UPI00398ADB2A
MPGRDGFLKRLDFYFNIPTLQQTPSVSPSRWAQGGSNYYRTIGYNPGNDHLGTLGAWYVMAALGFQPVAPGSGIFALNVAKVQAATITLENGRKGLDSQCFRPSHAMSAFVPATDLSAKSDVASPLDLGTLTFTGATVGVDDIAAPLTCAGGGTDEVAVREAGGAFSPVANHHLQIRGSRGKGRRWCRIRP